VTYKQAARSTSSSRQKERPEIFFDETIIYKMPNDDAEHIQSTIENYKERIKILRKLKKLVSK